MLAATAALGRGAEGRRVRSCFLLLRERDGRLSHRSHSVLSRRKSARKGRAARSSRTASCARSATSPGRSCALSSLQPTL